MSLESEIRELLASGLTNDDELEWCNAAEEVLDLVLEGITMRQSELRQERED